MSALEELQKELENANLIINELNRVLDAKIKYIETLEQKQKDFEERAIALDARVSKIEKELVLHKQLKIIDRGIKKV